MKKSTTFSYLILLAVFTSSCSFKKEKDNLNENKLILKDSVTVKKENGIIGGLSIVDFNNEHNNFLAYDFLQKEIIEFSKKDGKVFNQISITGEGPNDCGADISGMNYIPEANYSQINVIGSRGFFNYDLKNGKQISKTPHTNLFLQDYFFKLFTFQQNNEKYYLSSTLDLKQSPNLSIETKSFYSGAKLLLLINKDKFAPLIPFHKSSVYLNQEGYFPSVHILYTAEIKNNLIFATYIFDPAIYCYELKKGELNFIKKIDYNIEGYKQPSSVPFGNKVDGISLLKKQISSTQIQNLYCTEDYLIVEYLNCLDPNRFKNAKSFQEITHELESRLNSQIGLHFIPRTSKREFEVLLPKTISSVQFVTKNNQIIAQVANSEEEAKSNQTKYYVFEIPSIK